MPSRSVTMFVMNSCDRDARVLKEARSLARAGYSVRVVATLGETRVRHEVREGLAIDRVRGPVHRRFLRWIGGSHRRTRRCGYLQGDRAAADPRGGRARLVAGNHEAPAGAARSGRRPHGLLAIGSSVRNAGRSVLLPIHRGLCCLDYSIRACHLVREAPSDIYHGHDLNALPAAWWARHRLGGKVVYDSHEIYTEMSGLCWIERKVAMFVERFLIRRVDAVITIHDTAAEELSRRYRVPKPSVVRNCPQIPAGCGRTTRLRDALGLQDTDLIILYQGGFSAYRGLPNLIRSMTHLPETAKLVMMGWGSIGPELRALASELELLGRRVLFLPPVPQGELLYWTASADVGVIPYQAVGLNNYLCMPNKLFEYMGAGLPIAASAFPELSRIIVANEVGLTFDPEDPRSIASAIGAILGDRELRARLSENARRASRIYNWENEEKNLLAVYAKVSA